MSIVFVKHWCFSANVSRVSSGPHHVLLPLPPGSPLSAPGLILHSEGTSHPSVFLLCYLTPLKWFQVPKATSDLLKSLEVNTGLKVGTV